MSKTALTVTCAFGFVGRERHSVRAVVSAVHNTASPENHWDWHNCLLAADQRAYSVVAITFKFSVAALPSLVPGRASSTNQLRLGLAACVNDVALSV